MFDINPRIGSTFRLFVSDTGMDVARALYLDLTGQPIPAGIVRAGRKWLVEDRDLYASLCYWRDRNLSTASWLRSFHGVKELSFVSVDDPRPFFAMLRNGVGDLFRRIKTPAQIEQRPASHDASKSAVEA